MVKTGERVVDYLLIVNDRGIIYFGAWFKMITLSWWGNFQVKLTCGCVHNSLYLSRIVCTDKPMGDISHSNHKR